jgi:hypothetical protein
MKSTFVVGERPLDRPAVRAWKLYLIISHAFDLSNEWSNRTFHRHFGRAMPHIPIRAVPINRLL